MIGFRSSVTMTWHICEDAPGRGLTAGSKQTGSPRSWDLVGQVAA